MPSWKEGKTYRAQFQFQGTRHGQSGFASKKEADKWIILEKERMEKEPDEPASLPPACSPLTLGELMLEYMHLAERTLAPKTIAYRKTVFRRFLQEVGDIPVADITIKMIERHLLARPTNHNFNKCRVELCRLFSWGQRRQMITFNPVLLVDRVPVDRAKKVIPTPEEVVKILLAAGPNRPLLLVLFHTMARIDEVLRLTWEDVNFTEKWVKLWTRKRRGGNWESDLMPMNEDLEKILWSLWQSRAQDEWVFFNAKTYTRYLYRPKIMGTICKHIGVKKYGFHTLRHFVASYLFDKKKVSLAVISKLLRHKNLQTTERYLQAIDPRFRETMRLLEGNALAALSEIDVAAEV
ncbi:MAG: site-specific integrase [Candidatus Micrarchaeia archaeon]|jgi:integrase